MKLTDLYNTTAFVFACSAVGLTLILSEPVIASLIAISFFVISVVLSKFEKLDKAKLDFDDKSIELDGDNDETK